MMTESKLTDLSMEFSVRYTALTPEKSNCFGKCFFPAECALRHEK